MMCEYFQGKKNFISKTTIFGLFRFTETSNQLSENLYSQFVRVVIKHVCNASGS